MTEPIGSDAVRKSAKVMPDAVIAVMAYGRAGSGLWSSLLDSHPNILMFPDCVIMDFFSFWERHGHRSALEVSEAFVRHYSVAFDAQRSNPDHFNRFALGDHLGFCAMGPDKNTTLFVDAQRFLSELSDLIDFEAAVSRRLFFQAVHVAYARAQGREVSDPIIAFGLHVASELAVWRLLDDFPRTVFMQTVREPVKGMASWFRHFDRTGAVTPGLFVSALDMALDTGRPSPEAHRLRWFAVRLEDVHSAPEPTLRRVASWLGLPWDLSLLMSTFNGLMWWNEKRSIEVSGFSTRITAQTYDEYLSGHDRWRLGIALNSRRAAWGYSNHVHSPFRLALAAVLLILPFRMEILCWRSFASTSSATLTARAREAARHYWRARRTLLKAIFKPNLVEMPVLTDPATSSIVAPNGRELMTVGGAGSMLADEFFERGKTLLAQGKIESAIDALTAAIACAPNLVHPYALRADAYLALGNLEMTNIDRGRAGLPPFPSPPVRSE